MSALAIDTPAGENQSTPRPLYAARRLAGKQRGALALQGLAGAQSISTLSARSCGSRKFVYQQMHQACAALRNTPSRAGTHDELFQASRPVLTSLDLDSLYWLPASC